ncbi:DUF1573 domain-containing protein [Singulisphaera sp. Ch08]|uniref:DUF1573 domain-containing protein n=1 Tax=Singulisphaera sp. Ch08 TaxID=3120278 RepID=A0AAU7CLS2_9BACT
MRAKTKNVSQQMTWCAAMFAALLGCRKEEAFNQSASSSSGSNLPVLSAKPLNLGEVSAGKSVAGSITLTNNSGASVTVTTFDTSCPCLKLTPKPVIVESHGTKVLDVYFDSAEEPDFAGKLSIEVIGKDKNGFAIFKTDVLVSVIRMQSQQSTKRHNNQPNAYSVISAFRGFHDLKPEACFFQSQHTTTQ